MKDDLAFMRLWDLYSPLLTENSREITDLYFNYDLSLGEIAEQKGVSRQSVSDCLQKSRQRLEEYDKKLGFLELLENNERVFSAYKGKVESWIQAKRQAYAEWADELESLQKGLDETLENGGIDGVDDKE